MKYYLFPLIFLILSCQNPSPELYFGQGIMVGEVAESSAIFQSRLTVSDTLVDGYMPGKAGWGRFEWTNNDWKDMQKSPWIAAVPEHDFILKFQANDLLANSKYTYRVIAGEDSTNVLQGPQGSFKTLAGKEDDSERSLVVVTGMNYYHFHFGKYNRELAYAGEDKDLGYPALESIKNLGVDYFVGTGDNVYFDHPNEKGFNNSVKKGNDPHPGWFGGIEAKTEAEIRRKYHLQFSQPRFKALFAAVGTYWEKDDHDYRFNDADPYRDFPIAHDLGIKNFQEQLPVVSPLEEAPKTYRTHRINESLQIWLVEGRDYRSNNKMEDGPDKTLWGKEQITWLKRTLQASDAPFKLLISPTPMVGPDDAYKTDNHVNLAGFRYERDQFIRWLDSTDILNNGFYVVCGDRHWQYHAQDPSGLEEFSTGALVDNNSRAGRLAGDPNSTDPKALIEQFYIQGDNASATGGFLRIRAFKKETQHHLVLSYFDEKAKLLYETEKKVP